MHSRNPGAKRAPETEFPVRRDRKSEMAGANAREAHAAGDLRRRFGYKGTYAEIRAGRDVEGTAATGGGQGGSMSEHFFERPILNSP